MNKMIINNMLMKQEQQQNNTEDDTMQTVFVTKINMLNFKNDNDNIKKRNRIKKAFSSVFRTLKYLRKFCNKRY